QSTDGKQIISIGWLIDPSLNRDSNPHLFVGYWVNGSLACYNGCGYVQTSKKLSPGTELPVTDVPQTFVIMHEDGKWWLKYQSKWIGYFPDSLWSSQGVTFNKANKVAWFGEVSQGRNEMGNGLFGTRSDSALVQDMLVMTSHSTWIVATASPAVKDPNCYNVGNFSGASFHYGGPGC
ncbi:MAG TPA: neprosin family prolyl endopeptidase, partial [Ktedonobacteraceae bacterium]|nr:neprosin family prolyl endopeptidase [Ktedonobacteraceae bacterium]